VLVEGRPVLPAEKVSHLVDRTGHFRTDMAAAGATMFFHPGARRQLEAEIEAQFAAFAATGLPLDHVNAHKHFHLHPTIAGLILKVGARHGMNAARVPFEPGAFGNISPMRLMAGALRSRFARAGITTPDQVFGLRWSGAMTTSRLRGLIETLPQGLTEIYLHPALWDDYPGSAPGYQYCAEFSALMAPEVVDAAARYDIARGGFRDFAP
jgi:hopanoid biosynthesis associated protein HpnK